MSKQYVQVYIPVSYHILIILIFIHLIMTLFVYFILGKAYMYAFCLKQGGVMQPHSLNILYGYKT